MSYLTNYDKACKLYSNVGIFGIFAKYGHIIILSILWMAVNGNNIARREVKTLIESPKK